MLPMMEAMQSLFKMAQCKDTFVCDLVSSIILCNNAWCVDPLKKYDHPQFWTFNDLGEHVCDALHMVGD